MPHSIEHRLLNLLSAQEWHLDRLYGEYSNEFGSIFKNFKGTPTAAQKRQLQTMLTKFSDDAQALFTNQINNSFSISNLQNDELVKSYTKGLEVKETELTKLLTTNTGAANAFINRKTAGLDLSKRVWNLTNQTEESLNVLLESGVVNGRSAKDMAKDIKTYLKEPNKQFRRVRDARGKLVLSTPAQNYNPGQGVYRSSYQNALRLSRNEINIAYRTNDFERRQKMSFVMGHQVSLSGSHPEYDLCDELVGSYPKDFKFTGWHVNCLCISTSILLPRDKFKEYLRGGSIDNRHLIKTVPKPAMDFINDNAEKIKNYKNPPYFIADNFKPTKTGYTPKL